MIFVKKLALGCLLGLSCALAWNSASGLALAQGTPLTRAEVAQRAKPAVAFVVTRGGQGTAFCVHASGLFVSNAHVVQDVPINGKFKLVLNSGQADEKIHEATVVKTDRARDLALLKVDTTDTLKALPLSEGKGPSELDEVIAFGFPFGTALADKNSYPTITVNIMHVTSLKMNAQAELDRIQLDSNFNPGNSGGPIVDRSGKVIGVAVSAVLGAGINLAIPTEHVGQFLDQLILDLKVPVVAEANQGEPAEFQVTVASIFGAPSDVSVDLILKQSGQPDRVLPMKRTGEVFKASAIPFPNAQPAEPTLPIELRFADGWLRGKTHDLTVRLGPDSFKLSQVKKLTPGSPSVVEIHSGRQLSGLVDGLELLTISLGGANVAVNWKQALEVKVFAPPTPPQDSSRLICEAVVRKGTKMVGHLSRPLYLEGTRAASFELMRSGEFVRPRRAASGPVTYLKIQGTPGDFVSQGKNYEFGPTQLRPRPENPPGISFEVDSHRYIMSFSGPNRTALAVGEYLNAKRFPINGSSPGLCFLGGARGENSLTGKFVIWELEVVNGLATRAAIDFEQRGENRSVSLYGMLRFNSEFE